MAHLRELFPVVPSSWWCGEYQPQRQQAAAECGSCKFWLRQVESEGYCRRYPPQLVDGER